MAAPPVVEPLECWTPTAQGEMAAPPEPAPPGDSVRWLCGSGPVKKRRVHGSQHVSVPPVTFDSDEELQAKRVFAAVLSLVFCCSTKFLSQQNLNGPVLHDPASENTKRSVTAGETGAGSPAGTQETRPAVGFRDTQV